MKIPTLLLALLLPIVALAQSLATPKPLTLLARPQVIAVCAGLLNVAADADAADPTAADMNSTMTRLLMLREVLIDSEQKILPVPEMTELLNRALAQSKQDFFEQFSYCGDTGNKLLAQLSDSKKLALLSRAVAYREQIIAKRKK